MTKSGNISVLDSKFFLRLVFPAPVIYTHMHYFRYKSESTQSLIKVADAVQFSDKRRGWGTDGVPDDVTPAQRRRTRKALLRPAGTAAKHRR